MEKLTLSEIALDCGAKAPEGAGDITVSGISTDSRAIVPGGLFVALTGEKYDGHDYIGAAEAAGAAAALCQKEVGQTGIPVILVKDTRRALMELARAYRGRFSPKTVGVTGSVGKTTTKEIIASVLSQRFDTLKNEGNLNNDIGVPLSLMRLEKRHEAAVFEMGMNHFGELSALTSLVRPDIAIITNIGITHIEYLGSREGILRAKLEILEGLRPGGVAIFNGDEPLLWALKGKLGCDILYYGVENSRCDIRAAGIKAELGGMTFSLSAPSCRFDAHIPMAGRHNVYNSLAAAAVALRCGLTPEQIITGLAGAKSAGMRQHIFEAGGITIVEDCYNASPDSMAASLGVLSELPAGGRKYAVLGGMLELGSETERAHVRVGRLAASCADVLLVYGKGAEGYMEGARMAGMRAENIRAFDSHQAIAVALRMDAAPGDAILFKGSRGMRMEEALGLFLEAGK